MSTTGPFYVSVLGDSISSLSGVTPSDGAFYHTAFSRNTGIVSAADTWWMQVIDGMGGTLLVNDAYAGSTVSCDGYQPAAAPWRIAKLKSGDIQPDCILVFSGLNDVAFYRSPAYFGEQYAIMVRELRSAFPASQIYCATLCGGVLANPEFPLFVNLAQCTPLSEYNVYIRKAVADAGCHLVELEGLAYQSIDGAHPNAEGMRQISALWLRSIQADK